jgi:hypothetical protein
MAKQLTTLGSLESTSHFTTTAIGVHNKLFDASVTGWFSSQFPYEFSASYLIDVMALLSVPSILLL